ncbi:hypothetical protein BG004_007854, partial [Podila humilis]
IPTLKISKQELERLLGIKLNLDLNLDIMSSDEISPCTATTSTKGTGDGSDKNPSRFLVGRIPVHIKIHSLTIGGVLAPALSVKDMNRQLDSVNYGDIKVEREFKHE